MTLLKIIVPSLLLLLLVGCSGVQVSHDYDPGRSFFGMNTYAWQSQRKENSEDLSKSDPLLHKRFYSTINRVLEERGYRQERQADFLIKYGYAIATQLESDPVTTSFGFGTGPRRHFGGLAMSTGSEIRQYDVGMLVIDVFESTTNELVWRGRGSERIPLHTTPQQTTAMVDRLVRAVMAQFPPEER